MRQKTPASPTDIPLRIGLSLPVFYLCGEDSGSYLYRYYLGRPERFLRRVKMLGISSIEFRDANAHKPAELILRAAENVWSAGLDTTVHTYLSDNSGGKHFSDFYPGLASFALKLKQNRKSSVLTLHSFSSYERTLPELLNQTVGAVKRISKSITGEDIPLKIAVEITQKKERIDPGNDFQNIYNIVVSSGAENAGLCWDFGHSYANALKGYPGAEPAPEHLARVIHAHVHDLNEEHRTHHPLSCSTVPLKRYICSLENAGYEGIYNMELNLDRFTDRKEPVYSIEKSLDILRKTYRG